MQEALLDVCRYWLDMGVDGFRLDVCAFYFHDRELRDNPANPNPPAGAYMFNPYGLQRHIHDIERPETLGFIERMREVCDGYEGRILLGELHEGEIEPLHPHYTAPNRLQLAYSFWLLAAEEIGARRLRELAGLLGHGPGDGWPCWAIDNHDFPRAITRLNAEATPEAVTVLYAALACLRGATCLYQGSELGLPDADVPFERIVDPYGREFWPDFTGRDGSRTPMPWDGAEPNAGFSDADETWLPVPTPHAELAVAAQEGRSGSTLERMRRFLVWRRDKAILRRGEMAFLDVPEPVLGFTRSLDGHEIVCFFNLGDKPQRVAIGEAEAGTPVEGHGFGAEREAEALVLPPYGAWFGERPADTPTR